MDPFASSEVFVFDRYRLDRRRGGLFRESEDGGLVPVPLGSRALDVLTLLLGRCGDLLTKEEIFASVWSKTVIEESNLTVQIPALRRVLDQGRASGSCIQTVSGHGYRFVVPVARQPERHATSFTESDARPTPRLSIVVLPFANPNNDPEQQYFADGITEDLTTDLSRIQDMLVISRNTAFTYQGKRIDTRQIGRDLGVRYVLEGSVRRSGTRVRVSAQLIDAKSDTHLWAERFDGDTSNLFALQDEITSRIAVALGIELIAAEVARSTAHPDALDYVLRGRAASSKPQTPGNYAEAIGLFERALALDPRSVEAQSRLGSALAGRVIDNMIDTAVADISRAADLVAQALAASPHSAFAHHAKGNVLRAQRRFAEAIPEYETALALDRNLAHAFFALGQCKVHAGSVEEAIPLLERVIRLNPRDGSIGSCYLNIGRVHLLESRIDEAIVWIEKACNRVPNHPNFRAWLASAYALTGEIERASTELAEARRLSGDDRYSTIARLRAVGGWGVPKVRALHEATYFAGLRKAGMPEQ